MGSIETTPIRYIAGVSWPRSGHHLLVRLMRGYFGDRFHYCEFYSENLDCCRQFPCARPLSISFSKNHDFDLEIVPDENVPHIVQYRDFFNSVVSDFELYIRHAPESDNREGFNIYSAGRARKYRKFYKKWIKNNDRDNIILVPYESLVSDTEAVARRCVEYFAPGVVVDTVRLKDVVSKVDGERVENRKIVKLANVGIHKSRDYKEFRFYDKQWYESISIILKAD